MANIKPIRQWVMKESHRIMAGCLTVSALYEKKISEIVAEPPVKMSRSQALKSAWIAARIKFKKTYSVVCFLELSTKWKVGGVWAKRPSVAALERTAAEKLGIKLNGWNRVSIHSMQHLNYTNFSNIHPDTFAYTSLSQARADAFAAELGCEYILISWGPGEVEFRRVR